MASALHLRGVLHGAHLHDTPVHIGEEVEVETSRPVACVASAGVFTEAGPCERCGGVREQCREQDWHGLLTVEDEVVVHERDEGCRHCAHQYVASGRETSGGGEQKVANTHFYNVRIQKGSSAIGGIWF